MILCPNCFHKEWTGVVFCSRCGAQMIHPEAAPTTIKAGDGAFKVAAPKPATVAEPDLSGVAAAMASMSAPVALNILGGAGLIELTTSGEIILGRASEGQPIVPDVDLTPFKAYESGVSRMHACLRIEAETMTITDLGSANGTRINGRQISAHIPYPVKHGDMLTLGRFKIQILQRNRS